MVGKLDYPHATTDEDKFRCFVYEYKDPLTPSKGLFLAQSGDATCNGLFSPHEGSRTLNLKAGERTFSLLSRVSSLTPIQASDWSPDGS